jgi:hypothetical protein
VSTAVIAVPAARGKGKQTTRLVEIAKQILAAQHPTTVRSVCYQLFVAGIILNMGKSCTNGVSRLLRLAREEGTIPWQWIVDESREAEVAQRWNNPDEIIAATVRGYRRDYWQDQDYRVEIWSEKGTVRGTLGPVLAEYGVTFRVMHGYTSATSVNDVAEYSNDDDKPLIALYCGDWDPSGKHMSDMDLPERLDRYGAEVQLIRIALTDADLTRPRLPRTDPQHLPGFSAETKRKDPRYKWFTKHFGKQCCELDALPAPELRARVEKKIRRYIDMPRWDHAKMIERAEVESMEDFYDAWLATSSKPADAADSGK